MGLNLDKLLDSMSFNLIPYFEKQSSVLKDGIWVKFVFSKKINHIDYEMFHSFFHKRFLVFKKEYENDHHDIFDKKLFLSNLYQFEKKDASFAYRNPFLISDLSKINAYIFDEQQNNSFKFELYKNELVKDNTYLNRESFKRNLKKFLPVDEGFIQLINKNKYFYMYLDCKDIISVDESYINYDKEIEKISYFYLKEFEKELNYAKSIKSNSPKFLKNIEEIETLYKIKNFGVNELCTYKFLVEKLFYYIRYSNIVSRKHPIKLHKMLEDVNKKAQFYSELLPENKLYIFRIYQSWGDFYIGKEKNT